MSGGDPLATCRNIPLDRVAAALGYRRDPADRARFKRDGSVISINGARFFDHLSGTGGGGAIDLVIHATGCRFRDALHFLGGHEGCCFARYLTTDFPDCFTRSLPGFPTLFDLCRSDAPVLTVSEGGAVALSD